MVYRVAVILPAPYTGGVVRSVINICRMLAIGAKECGDELQLTLGLPKDQAWSPSHQRMMTKFGIEVRYFERRTMALAKLTGSYASYTLNISHDLPPEALIFDDGIANFEDSEFWYLISDAVPAALPAHRKYACMIYDYANRYVPGIFDENQWCNFHLRAAATQNAAFVVTTTPQGRRDAINFAGAAPDRVHVFPIEFDPVDCAEFDPNPAEIEEHTPKSFVLWPTIISPHENHLAILEGLDAYFKESTLRVLVIGKSTNSFDPLNETPAIQHPYVESVRRLIASSALLRERVIFLDYVSDEVLLVLMRRSVCVLHTSRGDNGTYTVVEAAWQGVPSLSNRYPAMEEVGLYFGLPLEFFDFYRPGSLADGLDRILKNHSLLCAKLPSPSQLQAFSFENLAVRYWQLFSVQMRTALGIA